jgi:1,4-dihydroxy-2-naphthoate octaprenyltransferase
MSDVAARAPGNADGTTDGAVGSLPARWRYALATTNPPAGTLDPVTRWLVLTRAGVLPMTLVAAAQAGLLGAFRDADVAWAWYGIAALGIVLAHAANNLMNDLFDLDVGSDTADYPRNLYAPHPVLSGMISRAGLATAALVVNAVCLAIMLVLVAARGWPVAAFALGGFLLSAAYTAPPLRLKRRGLGEPTVVVVWGPLMVGGTFYAATGTIPAAVVLASLPYAVLCTTVLMGKHVDKEPWDAPAGTNTLPVLLGEARARRLTQAMFVAFYALVAALAVARVLPWATLLVFLSLPRLRTVWSAFSEPKPARSPVPNPVWPLWFAPHAFLLTRRAGGLLVLGLVVGALVGW